MGKRKKKFKCKRPVSFEEAQSHVKVQPYFALKQWRNTKYYISTDGFVYRKKGSGRYIPIEMYEYHSYYNVDLYLRRRGKDYKKRYMVHRLVMECYCYNYNKEITCHHIRTRYDNSVNNLYACPRGIHDLIEFEGREVLPNLMYNTFEDEEW